MLRLGKEAMAFDRSKIMNKNVKRKLKMISKIGPSVLPETKLDKYNMLTNEMSKIYSTAKVPSFKDKDKLVSLEPEITLILAESKDPEELEYYWTEWRKVTGEKIREHYRKFLKLVDEAAK